MISDLDDLIRYSEDVAKRVPLIAARVRITRPGNKPDVIEALRRAFPNLPDSYLYVVESIAIGGIAIGYFGLTPSASRSTSLLEQLRVCNDPTITPMAEHYRQHGVYQVASWEADPLCVAHSDGAFKVGQVVKYNDGMPDAVPLVLADNFEQLLLIAGNLQEISGEYNEPTRAISEFRAYLTPIVADRQDDLELAWTQIASVVLG